MVRKKLLESLTVLNEMAIGLILTTTLHNGIPRIHCSDIAFPRVSYKCYNCKQNDPRLDCEAQPT